MKRLLLLVALATVAWAKPSAVARCPESGAGFYANFSQPHKSVKDASGSAYGWEGKTSPLQSQMVLVTQAKGLQRLKNHLAKNLPAGVRMSSEQPYHLGKLQGVQLEGLTESGVPFTVRLLSTPAHGFIYGSFTYDMAANRAFVDSFTIVPK